MVCVLGCDHAGVALIGEIEAFLGENPRVEKIIKCVPQEPKADYPDYAKRVCDEVKNHSESIGILVCGSGIGMSMSANKIQGIRAALCLNEYMARYARAHNDANVLCLGARILGVGLAKDIVEIFLNTAFEGGRHRIRVEKMKLLER